MSCLNFYLFFLSKKIFHMPDTRRVYVNGVAVQGFHAGNAYTNQVSPPAAAQVGVHRWRPHATIDSYDRVNQSRRVKSFHISMYREHGNQNFGVFSYTFRSATDQYVCSGFSRDYFSYRRAVNALQAYNLDQHQFMLDIMEHIDASFANLSIYFGSSIGPSRWHE